VRELSAQAGQPIPKLYLISDPQPNAFAVRIHPPLRDGSSAAAKHGGYQPSHRPSTSRGEKVIASLMIIAIEGSDRFTSFDVPLWVWAALVGVIVVLLVADLLIVHRTPHVITFKEAAIESGVWIGIGLAFTLVMGAWQGGGAAGEYLAGYLIEKSLSIDNVFVWAVIFGYFSVPAKYQFRVLFWGIFGALVLRAAFIFAGIALIERFDWILYVFGVFLIITAVKIARHKEAEIHPESNPVLKVVRRLIPISNDYDGHKLFTRLNGRLIATPLFAVLVLIETTDVVFAVDSVPAILAISRQPFIVFASNAFAILGLRALYFCLAGMAGKFRYLNIGLGVILGFVGIKMLIADIYHFPIWASLAIIALTLTVTIIASLLGDRRPGGQTPKPDSDLPTPASQDDAPTR
jgi:tellurite resistance protein TerC